MHLAAPTFPDHFCRRYGQLARAVELSPDAPVLLALSGGADSIYLLHLLAAAEPRPSVIAVHVDHGLRGVESLGDAAFCEDACRRLDIPFVLRRAELTVDGPSLEARARDARYALLLAEAERRGISVVLTGHHADDALETILMRWSRGTALGGLAGLKHRTVFRAPLSNAPIDVVRPLIHMRREEVRCALESAGVGWREDSSNQDPRFTRNRVRTLLLPQIGEFGGETSVDDLRAFGDAVERLEHSLALATAHLAWRPLDTAVATRSLSNAHLGGTLPRSQLMRLPSALRRRAVWRLLHEGCGRAPRQRLLELLLDDLESGRTARHALPRGWRLELRADRLNLLPPDVARFEAPIARAANPTQRELPFPDDVASQTSDVLELAIPGIVDLADGRRIGAEWVLRDELAPPPTSPWEVELDARAFVGPLTVRFPRPGDRWHPLGSPGRRSLARFLSDSGVPNSERRYVPLVLFENEILWVAGLRPNQRRRVRDDSRRRLRLRLYGAPEAGEPRSTVHWRTGPLLFGGGAPA